MNKKISMLVRGTIALSLLALPLSSAFAQATGECDPNGPTPEMGALLNAPPKPGVEVIQKVPQHPGEIGPYRAPLTNPMGYALLALGVAAIGISARRS